MSFLAVVLVISASFTHATWNLIQKRAANAGAAFVFATSIFACAIYLPWVVSILADSGMAWNGDVFVCLAVSGLIHLAYSLSLQRGYQLSDLSVV